MMIHFRDGLCWRFRAGRSLATEDFKKQVADGQTNPAPLAKPGPTGRRLCPQDVINDVVAVDDPDEHIALLNTGDSLLL